MMEDLVDKISRDMLLSRGYDEKKDYVEFDKNNPESQLSMLIEDVQFVLYSLQDRRGLLDSNNIKIQHTQDTVYPRSNVVYVSSSPKTWTSSPTENEEDQESSTTTDVSIFVSTANPSLEDLLDFTERLQRLNIDQSQKMTGNLSVCIPVDETFVDRIACGDCGAEDYLVFSNEHTCES